MNNIVDKELKVAVFLITYNHKKYIAEAIESILNQKTNFKYKIYIGDDCSTDGTSEICQEFKIKNPEKIDLVIRTKNIGASKNALSIYERCFSSGAKYTAILDGDDYWTDPLKLQKQFDFMENNPDFSLCFHNCLIKQEYSHKESLPPSLFNGVMNKEFYSIEDVLDKLLMAVGSIFFRNEFINPLPKWYTEIIFGDLPLIILLAGKGKIKYLDFTGSVYRMNDAGIGKEFSGKFLAEGKIFLYKKIDAHFDYRYSEQIAPYLSKNYLMLSNINIREREFISAYLNFKNFIRLRPYSFFKFSHLVNFTKAIVVAIIKK
jgi:glycosyltransferase involved in cell wall biosynthesis